jgi:hypothetical protein
MRTISTQRRFTLLAPLTAKVPAAFRDVDRDQRKSRELLADMQRFRGRVYLQGGFIEAYQLTSDGRHQCEADNHSWHLLTLDESGEIAGCARYRQHDNTVPFSKLGVARSELARSKEWGGYLQRAVESQLDIARRLRLPYVELGGWALADRLRGTLEALRMVLATYALGQLLGGALGITTARRDVSSPVLQKTGGAVLDFDGLDLPVYYDPQYKCDMQILRFDAWSCNAKYKHMLEDMREYLSATPLVTGERRLTVQSKRRIPALARPQIAPALLHQQTFEPAIV